MDFDLIIIGSGPGGYFAALKAAKLGLKVACIEKEALLGGTCLRVGCIPSKALLYATELAATVSAEGECFGYTAKGKMDFSKLMDSKDATVQEIASGIDLLFQKDGVTKIQGKASFIDSHTVKVNERAFSAKNFLIASGSVAIPLPFLPFDEKKVLSSTGALQLSKIPKTLTVVGAGSIGLELASIYARLGAKIEVVEMLSEIAPFLDREISKSLQKNLEKQGFTFYLNAKVLSGEKKKEGVLLEIGSEKEKRTYLSEAVLVAIGRKPYIEGLELQKAGVQLNSKGQITVQSDFQTTASHIYAIGDVIDGPMLAHKASEEAVVVVEALMGKPSCIDYLAVPNVIYTNPEACAVGLTEESAKKWGFTPMTGVVKMGANARALASFQKEGLCKVIGDKKSGRLLGLHLLCAHGSEMIQIGSLAIKERLTVRTLAKTCFPHPTLSEVIKEACLKCLGEQVHG